MTRSQVQILACPPVICYADVAFGRFFYEKINKMEEQEVPVAFERIISVYGVVDQALAEKVL